ncbi:MAG: CYTH domain-containing protein [Gemmatimonadota bacterium]|nr:MAG: CYTH domain-containing protein [Gemmatimonadota bacterium]
MAEPQYEVEAKLAIRSHTPQVVADEIAQLKLLGGWTLWERDPVSVQDIYLDLPGLQLEDRGVALRLRRAADRYLITLKGPEARVGDALQREELEREWSRETVDQIARTLRDWGIRLPRPPSFSGESHPSAALARWGLIAVQNRETARRRRAVGRGLPGGTVTAELAIDQVVYQIGGRGVRHYEVEVELCESDRVAALADILAALSRKWPALMIWPYSKYTTGKALHALLAEPQPGLEITSSGDLLPSVYARVEKWLAEQPD